MRARRAALTVIGSALVVIVCIFATSDSRSQRSSLSEQELWNPATYYNVFAPNEVVQPAAAEGWSQNRVREELHKLIGVVTDMQTRSDANAAGGQSSLDTLKDQQTKDITDIQTDSDAVNKARNSETDVWSAFSQTLATAGQKETSDMNTLQAQLISTLNSIKQQQSDSDGPRAAALTQAKADVASAQQVLVDINNARDSVKQLAAQADSENPIIAGVIQNATHVRDSVEAAIKAAQDVIDRAETSAAADIAAVAKGVSDASDDHASKFADLGKKLDDVSTALNALSQKQSEVHDQIVNDLAAVGNSGSSAISNWGGNETALITGVHKSISDQLTDINTDITALQTAISSNTIEANTTSALSSLQQTLASIASDSGTLTAQVTTDVSGVLTNLGTVASLNSDTSQKADALKAVLAAIQANDTARVADLASQIQASFTSGPFSLVDANKAKITDVTKDIANLTATNAAGIAAVNDLVKKLQSSYTAQVGQLATLTTQFTKDVSDQSSKFASAVAPLQSGADAATLADQVAFNATVKLLSDVQTKLASFTTSMDALTRPAGPAGPPGPVGLPGPMGAPGDVGDTGPAGPPGVNGVAGAVGPQGPAGDMGPKGPVGETGAAGAVGNVGPQGMQGPNGADGPQGPNGTVGAPGIVGADGPPGPQGSQGNAGITGIPGVPGATGAAGAAGKVGSVGAQGPPGPAGPPGIPGATGLAGAIGQPGPPGPAGVVGPKGAVGSTGPAGNAGPLGAVGEPGPAGPVGAPGSS